MATTTKIIVYPLTISFNMFGGSNWYSSSYQSSSTNLTTEQAGLGRTTGNVYRTTVLKFTTPSTFKSGITNKKLTVRFSARSNNASATNSGTFYYRISKTGPSFTTASAQFPAADASGVFAGTSSITFTTSYKRFEITTSAHDFTANTTYYMWLISEPPKDGAMGYVQNNATSRIELDFECTDTITYTKINASGLAHHNGFYSGAKVAIRDTDGNLFTSGYAYCNWAGRGSSFYAQKVENNSDWSRFQYGFTLDANTTTTTNYRTLYAFHAPQSLGNPITYYPKGFIFTYNVPRFACNIYCGTSTPTLFVSTSSTTATPTAVSGYTCTGITSSATGTTPTLTSPITLNANRDGGTYYAIYTKSLTTKLYYGGTSYFSLEGTYFLYGMGYTVFEPTSSLPDLNDLICSSDSSFGQPLGWTGTINSYTLENNDYIDLIGQKGYTTIYSIYSKGLDQINKSGPLWVGDKGSKGRTWTFHQPEGMAYIYGQGAETIIYDDDIEYTGDFTYGGSIPYKDITLINKCKVGSTWYYELDTPYTAYHYANNGDIISLCYEGYDYLIFNDNENISVIDVFINVNTLYGDCVYIEGSYPSPQTLLNKKFIGWYDDNNNKLTFTIDSVTNYNYNLSNNNIRTVYAKYIPYNNVKYGNNDNWKEALVYYGNNNIWQPIKLSFGQNNNWKNQYIPISFYFKNSILYGYEGQTWSNWCTSEQNHILTLEVNNNIVQNNLGRAGTYNISQSGVSENILGTDIIIAGANYTDGL